MAGEINFLLLDDVMKILLFIAVHVVILKVCLVAIDHIKQKKWTLLIIINLVGYFLYTFAIDYEVIAGEKSVLHMFTYIPSFVDSFYEKMFYLLFIWTMLFILYALVVAVKVMFELEKKERAFVVKFIAVPLAVLILFVFAYYVQADALLYAVEHVANNIKLLLSLPIVVFQYFFWS